MNTEIKKALVVTLGVALAGLVMKYGKDLPIIKQAKQGFSSNG